MSFSNVNIGTTPGDHTGDPLRTAFNKINNNFHQITSGQVPITVNAPVTAVAGRTGNVNLTIDDVTGGVSTGELDLLVDAHLLGSNISVFTNDSSYATTTYVDVRVNALHLGYGNSNVASYLVANPQSGTYSNANVTAYLSTQTFYSNTNAEAYFGANIGSLWANAGVQADAITSLQANIIAANLAIAAASGTYSNSNVAAYLTAGTSLIPGVTLPGNVFVGPTSGSAGVPRFRRLITTDLPDISGNISSYLPAYSGNIAANVVKNGYTWTFGNNGNLSLPQGTILSETANSTTITPPNALAGQGLVVRLTGVQGIVSDHPGGFTDGDTITITVTPDYSYAQVTGTVDYTFTGATSQQLGRALTGTLTFTSESYKEITWTIPVSSTMTTFTITLSNASGFDISGIAPLTLTGTGSSEDHHVHLISGDPSITDIYLGDDDQYVKIEKNGGNVVIGTDTNTKQWNFDTDGNLSLPTGGYLQVGSGIVPGSFISSPAPVISGFSTISAENFTFLSNGVNILSTVTGNYGNVNVAEYLPTYPGNVQANYFVGNGAALNLVAGSYSYTFDNTGNLTMPTNGDVIMPGTNSILSVSGTTLLGGYSQVTGYYSTLGIKYPGAGTQHGMTLQPAADNTTAINFLNASGNSVGNITQTASTVKFTGDGSGLSNVAIKTTGSWTVTTGTNTYSFTVPINGVYQLWVDCNIPNGILVWNATATVTNTNVPIVGQQFAWVYDGGGTPIDFTSIPAQFVGTANAIVRSHLTPSATTNRFDFGINNTSGSNQTVYWGYVTLD